MSNRSYVSVGPMSAKPVLTPLWRKRTIWLKPARRPTSIPNILTPPVIRKNHKKYSATNNVDHCRPSTQPEDGAGKSIFGRHPLTIKTWKSDTVTISVDYEKCVGHGDCADSCPSEVYEIVDGKAVPERIGDCIECCTCVEVCPEKAIVYSACE